MLLLLLLLALVVGKEAKPLNGNGLRSLHKRFVNSYDEPIDFSCPDHQSIYLIYSIENRYFKDRLWDFYCKPTFDTSHPISPQKGNYVNDFDGEVNFTCPVNSVVTAIGSYHDNWAEDRRWKFTCTMQAGVCMDVCQWTDYLNDFHSLLFWVAPDVHYLTGVHSYHCNVAEDRRWKFQYCSKVSCRTSY
ncbi:hemagglutinin/amebocyte aggregation factor-like [Lampetra fluviatilis]